MGNVDSISRNLRVHNALCGKRARRFYWPEDRQISHDNPQAFVKGYAAWGKRGVVVNMMRKLPVSLYSGERFDIGSAPIVPHVSEHLPAIWAFWPARPDFNSAVRRNRPGVLSKVTNAAFALSSLLT